MKTLTLDEMLWLLKGIRHPSANEFEQQMVAVGTLMAREIGTTLDVGFREASSEEPEFGGTCANFFAKHPEQACPQPLRSYDPGEWTDEDGEDLDEETGEEG